MNERFSYHGSAAIGGVQLPNVRLQENVQDGGLRSWEGSARFHADDTPGGFPGNLEGPESALIELPDGRTGQVLVTSIGFNGINWTVGLLGTGPAPR